MPTGTTRNPARKKKASASLGVQMMVTKTADPSTTLRCGRDDKGDGGASSGVQMMVERLQIPPLRFDGRTKGRAALPAGVR
jgi:hypothetical protein